MTASARGSTAAPGQQPKAAAVPAQTMPPAPVPARKILAPACRWLSLLASLPVMAMSVVRAVPGAWPVLAVQLVSFTPWLAVPAMVALVLALLGRSRWLQVCTAALLLCQVFWLFPFDAARPSAAPGAAATVELKAMTINAEYGQADATRIMELVRDNGIGLLTVQEHSQALQDRLAAAGLDTLLPHRISDPTDDAAGGAVYSSHPLEQVGLIPDTPFRMPTVRLTAEARGSVAVLEVTNVHALPPVDVRVDQWRSDLASVGRLAGRPGNRLLVGDFNATYDHSEFRQLLGAGPGLVDVGTASGSRLVPTWPMEGVWLPGITLDHLVTSRQVGSSGYQVHKVPGTDHAAVLATLAVPAT
ncbi:endonuclease/exonuclease/phosphatase family protein [Pseudarthrobacter sp. CCNWLW207]|uniref:endonuclease/exonuclease/phosphatase family protein n=1 Tax=Pseudarthrobacter sp. CCNWLW207 TaxID=3127468 RepID=UPI0030773F43